MAHIPLAGMQEFALKSLEGKLALLSIDYFVQSSHQAYEETSNMTPILWIGHGDLQRLTDSPKVTQ
jgi:hypothetical protein